MKIVIKFKIVKNIVKLSRGPINNMSQTRFINVYYT